MTVVLLGAVLGRTTDAPTAAFSKDTTPDSDLHWIGVCPDAILVLCMLSSLFRSSCRSSVVLFVDSMMFCSSRLSPVQLGLLVSFPPRKCTSYSLLLWPYMCLLQDCQRKSSSDKPSPLWVSVLVWDCQPTDGQTCARAMLTSRSISAQEMLVL